MALLVHDQEETFRPLQQTLRNLGIRTQPVHSCWEAWTALREPCSSRVILTATTLADGTWADVLDLASTRCNAIPVIVVSRFVDIGLYLKALESGASDFIVSPISPSDLAYVVGTAVAKGRPASA